MKARNGQRKAELQVQRQRQNGITGEVEMPRERPQSQRNNRVSADLKRRIFSAVIKGNIDSEGLLGARTVEQ